MSKSKNISQRVSTLRAAMGLSQDKFAQQLGVSRNYVSMVEQGRQPSQALINLIERLEGEQTGGVKSLREEPAKYQAESRVPPGAQPVRWVPLISWVHAGVAASYEELPLDQQDLVPTLCRDARAFALTVDGDSMTPRIEHGDQLIVMPGEEPRNGCIVVAKLKNDGVIVRRFSRLPNEKVRLIAYNTLYPSTEHAPRDFHWIYPVHSTVRREWN